MRGIGVKLDWRDTKEIARLYTEEKWSLKQVKARYHIGTKRVRLAIVLWGGQIRPPHRGGKGRGYEGWPKGTRRLRSLKADNPQCCYCGMRLELVRTVHETEDGRCDDMCFHHVKRLRRQPQGRYFWSDQELAEASV